MPRPNADLRKVPASTQVPNGTGTTEKKGPGLEDGLRKLNEPEPKEKISWRLVSSHTYTSIMLCIYIYMYIYIYTHTYVLYTYALCTYMYIYSSNTHTHTHAYIYMYICIKYLEEFHKIPGSFRPNTISWDIRTFIYPHPHLCRWILTQHAHWSIP